MSGDALELVAKRDARTRDENKRLDEFNSRADIFGDFGSTAKLVTLTAFGIMNNYQMNG